MTAPAAPRMIDSNIPRFNQAAVAALTGISFIVTWWPLVAAAWVGVAMNRFLGPRWGPFTRLYGWAIAPRLSGPRETERAEPPRFSQLLAVSFLGVAILGFLIGWDALAWPITLLVTALATLAAAARICVGCILYTWVSDR